MITKCSGISDFQGDKAALSGLSLQNVVLHKASVVFKSLGRCC